MKKVLLIITVTLSLFFLTGCFNLNLYTNKDVVETDFGTYRIDGLVKRLDHSTKDKVFYVLEKDEKVSVPDNISVNVGTNYYKKEDHLIFRRAIQEQLYKQVGKNATVRGSGITTTKGNTVYKFIITKMNSKTEITQYYIVGDYKYVLVYETNFTANPDLDNATYNIVDTFEWK